MKRVIQIFLGIALLVLFVGTMVFLAVNSGEKPKVYQTDSPFMTDIIKKTVATGSITPRKEVSIKSNVSGVVDKIYVTAGEFVKVGQLIAKIKIIPNAVTLNNSESTVNKAKINLQDAQREHDRQEKLYKDKLIAEAEYLRYQVSLNRAKEELFSAENNLQLVKEGSSKSAGITSTLVKSTVNGMLLDIPVREGTHVIESNTFNEGTSIASVADMNDMIFVGKVDESEVGKIKEGMKLQLSIGAIDDKKFDAVLEFISPKGVTDEGAIKFEIKAALKLQKDQFIRAGYSANADIVFDRKDSVMAIKESLLQFGKDSVFVEVETKPKVFEKRLIKTGISDGINIEVLSGVKMADKIKVAQVTGPAAPTEVPKK